MRRKQPAILDLTLSRQGWGEQDYREGIGHGYEDMKAGRVQPMEEFFEDLRVEYGFQVS